MTLLLGLLQRWLAPGAPHFVSSARVGLAATNAATRRASRAALDAVSVHGMNISHAGLSARTASGTHTARPLRVIRSVERSGRRVRPDGRLLISGSMAAVCAELDRLAALEDSRV